MQHKKRLIVVPLIVALTIALGILYFVDLNDNGSYVEQSKLPAFVNIDLDVKSADVKIIEGENFGINYSFHGREKIKELKVENETLILDTWLDFHDKGINFHKLSFGNWFVEITVPKDYELNEIELNSTSGDIEIKNRNFTNGDLSTTGGQILLENVACNDLNLDTVSEKIALIGSSVVGDVEAKSVSWDIEITMTASSIKAESIGDVYINGLDQGHKYEISNGKPSIEARSVSGEIVISTQ